MAVLEIIWSVISVIANIVKTISKVIGWKDKKKQQKLSLQKYYPDIRIVKRDDGSFTLTIFNKADISLKLLSIASKDSEFKFEPGVNDKEKFGIKGDSEYSRTSQYNITLTSRGLSKTVSSAAMPNSPSITTSLSLDTLEGIVNFKEVKREEELRLCFQSSILNEFTAKVTLHNQETNNYHYDIKYG